jgi:DNA repair protein RadC
MAENSPHYTDHRKRLKSRFNNSGLEAFHDYEVLEILLTYSIPRKDTKPIAKQLLKDFKSLKGVMDAEISELEKVEGIGNHSAILIKLIKEINNLYLKEKAMERPQITCTRELLDYCKNSMGGLKDEHFAVVYLDAQNRIIDMATINEGIVNQAVVYPRKVMENALQKKASAIILVHNHPSGHTRPSDADIRLTRTISETARTLDITVHDHIIIGENMVFSFREEGMMT